MADHDLTDAHQRLLEQLKGELDAYDMGMTDLEQVTDGVSGALDQLADLPPDLVEDLRSIWWPVQFALALSRDEERPLSDGEENDIRDAVAVLQRRLDDLGLPG